MNEPQNGYLNGTSHKGTLNWCKSCNSGFSAASFSCKSFTCCFLRYQLHMLLLRKTTASVHMHPAYSRFLLGKNSGRDAKDTRCHQIKITIKQTSYSAQKVYRGDGVPYGPPGLIVACRRLSCCSVDVSTQRLSFLPSPEKGCVVCISGSGTQFWYTYAFFSSFSLSSVQWGGDLVSRTSRFVEHLSPRPLRSLSSDSVIRLQFRALSMQAFRALTRPVSCQS